MTVCFIWVQKRVYTQNFVLIEFSKRMSDCDIVWETIYTQLKIIKKNTKCFLIKLG